MYIDNVCRDFNFAKCAKILNHVKSICISLNYIL